ncbi:trimeric intracellular cation channel family protein [Salinibacterium hongtaonis]|uniref:Glycine transporter domain-containing protein n=1 Tax=Homoserinimonas hongtaonis TaxID=2079791 RepID=A0A2U1SYZ1_9MICO|nr:TRIC cation channel family protein [Salinibacterium hongtaonis]AWB89395.1 hypothetical protein C2138_07470 [Salinibacterium hongtaonis]PWB96845.1 hypothetical protein DF220_02620 [Salinibacterium hongtaonis]
MEQAFSIPLWADLIAVSAGSIMGAMYAAGFTSRRIDLLGVAVIGIVTGIGGGIMRDLMLNEPLAALQTNWYLPVAVATALIGMLLERTFHRLRHVLTAVDALSLGLFGAIGTTKALAAGLPAIPAIFVGMLAAVGGGLLRDMLLATPIAIMQVGSLYAVAAFSGAGLIVLLETAGVPPHIAALSGVVLTFSVRILAVLFNWSLPEQRRLTQLPRLPRMSLGKAWPRRTWRQSKPGVSAPEEG